MKRTRTAIRERPAALPSATLERRILILAPTGNDAPLTLNFLVKAGLTAQICRDLPQFCTELAAGAGALVLAEETLGQSSISMLVQALAGQPPWSDIPIILITSGGEVSQTRLRRLAIFGPGGNVTLLERPFRPATLISTVEVALRSRQRQYETRRLVKELADARARTEATLDTADIGTWVWEVQEDRVFADKNLARIFSMSAEDAAGGSIRKYIQAIHPWDKIRVESAIKAALQSESGHYETDYRLKQPDGAVRWVTARGKVERDAAGRPVRFPGVVIDITARKAGEERERLLTTEAVAANAKFRAIFDQSSVFAGIMTVDGILIDANKLCLEGCGYQAEEVIGRLFWKTAWWRNSKEVQKKIRHGSLQVARGVTYREILPYWLADGTERIVDFALHPIFDDRGKVIFLHPTGMDITERKQTESILRQNEALFSALVDLAPTGVYVVDAEFRLQQINTLALPAFAKVEPKIGRDFSEVMTILWGPEVGGEIVKIFRHTLATGERYISPRFSEFRQDLAEDRAYEWEVQRVTRSDGRHGVVCYFNDITERLRSEQALISAKAAAESASRAKDDFLAALSHELRTPLNPALLIASESAGNHDLAEEVRLNFETIRKNIELEARLIDELLDLTRIISGKMVLDRGLVAVHDILVDALATVQAGQQEKNIQLTVKLDAKHSLVDGDAVRLQQVFWNVLKNAVKFTPAKGRIIVETADAGDRQLVIKITDTGIGMNAGEIARVFTAFAQGDHAGTEGSHRFGGLGLGLAISKNLVELHAGKITAFSPGSGLGSSFTIELPLAKKAEAAKKVEPPSRPETAEVLAQSAAQTSILLVEDHEITRTVLAQLLTRRNYKVVTADSIANAREIARQDKFDLLISDIGLPDGNGNDLMKELHEEYDLKGIALTGYGMEEDIARGKAAGFITHLTKPVRIESLETALALVKM